MNSEYKHGTIYKLVEKETGLFYFGSTILTLNCRLNGHKQRSKTYKSKLYDNFTHEKFCNNKIEIIPIEDIVFKDDNELRLKENTYIQCEKNNLNCLNSIQSNTGLPIKERKKIYQQTQTRKDRIKVLKQENKEQYQNYSRKYYEKNKEELNKIITCECGKHILKQGKRRHEKSQYHQTHINKQE